MFFPVTVQSRGYQASWKSLQLCENTETWTLPACCSHLVLTVCSQTTEKWQNSLLFNPTLFPNAGSNHGLDIWTPLKMVLGRSGKGLSNEERKCPPHCSERWSATEMHSLAHSLMQKWCTFLGEQSLHMLCVQAYRYTYIIYCTVSLEQLYQSNNPLNVVQSLSTWGPAVMGHSWDSALDGPYHQRYKQFAVPHLQPSFSLRKVHLRMYFFTLKV